MDLQKSYEYWLKQTQKDPELHEELAALHAPEEIADRFYRELEFGTAGLRGRLGAGTNRMNFYVVRRATQGLADYLWESGKNPTVAIAFDSRIKSKEFARAAAEVLRDNGITVYLSRELLPTPMLSYCVRALRCGAGVNITASHNPCEYNGYKCYGPDGGQMTEDAAGKVYEKMTKLDPFFSVEKKRPGGTILPIPEETLKAYLDCVFAQSVCPECVRHSELKVLYTPLNGAGNKPVRSILKRLGLKNLELVREQEEPDGTFKTCPYPNPEMKEAFACAFERAKTYQPDLILATDPDSDRLGAAVWNGRDYVLLSGNEVGCLLLHYVLLNRMRTGRLPERPVFVTTVVSSPMAEQIARAYGCQTIQVLTGFKYIGEQISLLEARGEENRFVFGYEESCGYLAGGYVRDKDAIVASMLLCEMAASCWLEGMTLLDVLAGLYRRYGYFCNRVKSYMFEGEASMKEMGRLMDRLRKEPPLEVAGFRVTQRDDYLLSQREELETGRISELALPKSNVLVWTLGSRVRIVVRPSGTEPKLKLYLTAVFETREESEAVVERLLTQMDQLLKS